MRPVIRDELKTIRIAALQRWHPTTVAESWSKERRRQLKSHRHVVGEVNFEPRTGRLSIRVSSSRSLDYAHHEVSKLAYVPWREVLPDRISHERLQCEMLGFRPASGVLVRLIRRGWCGCSQERATGTQLVCDLATFTFVIPTRPIEIGPERWDERDDHNRLLAANPEKLDDLRETVKQTPFGMPVTARTLVQLVKEAAAFVVLLDGKELYLDGLFDGRKWHRVAQNIKGPGNVTTFESSVGDPEIGVASWALPAQRPGPSTTAVQTLSHRTQYHSTNSNPIPQAIEAKPSIQHQEIKENTNPENSVEGDAKASETNTDLVTVKPNRVDVEAACNALQQDQIIQHTISSTAPVDARMEEPNPTYQGLGCEGEKVNQTRHSQSKLHL